jgi:hypothetical protein
MMDRTFPSNSAKAFNKLASTKGKMFSVSVSEGISRGEDGFE